MGDVMAMKFPWIILCFNLGYHCSSETLLLATDRGIKVLEPETSALTTIHDHPATSVDFRYKKQDVYFISGYHILYSYYSEYTNSHADPIPIITATHKLAALAVDWRNFKLYYLGSDTGTIYEAALLGTTIAPLSISEGATVSDLTLDVYDKRFFYIKDGALYMSFLHLREVPTQHLAYSFNSDSHRISSVSKVAVDHHTKEVFVVGYDDENLQWHLVSTDYKNSYSTSVFNGPKLERPFALEVFDGDVLWGSLSDGNYTIYSCKLTPTCQLDHLEVVFQSIEAINDAKFYNALIQTPNTDMACEELVCSHNCTVVSRYTVTCTCPPGFSIEPDGNICTKNPPAKDLAKVWFREVKAFLTTLTDALLQWLSTQSSNITTMILLCCVIMLVLLIFGFCVLACASKPKRSAGSREVYNLSKTRDQAVMLRDIDL